MEDSRRSGALARAARPQRQLASRRRARQLLGIAAMALGLCTPAAVADPVRMDFTDPVDQAEPGLDLVAGTISQDPITGTLTAHVVMAGPLTPNVSGVLRLIAGNSAPDGTCVASKGAEFVILAALDQGEIVWTLGAGSGTWRAGTGGRAGTAFDVTSTADGLLARTPSTCALVSTGTSKSFPTAAITVQDELIAKAELKPTVVGGQTAGSVTSDRDGDGLADITDACPGAAGTGPDGCPLATEARPFRLGARRLVVDRVMLKEQGATTCPAKVKVIVMQSGHRLGAAKLPTTDKGSGCEAQGVVRLKRRSKGKAVIAVLTAPGVVGARQQVSS